MTDKLVKVKLYGHLRKWGREFELYVKSPAEAVHALCTMLPGFKAFLQNSDKRGMEFAVFNGKQNISADELTLGAKEEIRIAPVYGGRKSSGVGQFITGAVLFAAGAALAYFSAGTLSTVGVAMMQMGAAMMIGGVVQMLSPQLSGTKMKEDDENSASYAFGGPVNTTAQGNPVGVLYGQREIGGAVISAGIFAENRM